MQFSIVIMNEEHGATTTTVLTRPLCNVDAPPVVILLLAAVDAPVSAAYAVVGDVTKGVVRRPKERRAVAAAPIRSWRGLDDACNVVEDSGARVWAP